MSQGKDLGATASQSLAVEDRVLARWLHAFVDAEKFDAKFGLVLPGDSALAITLNAAEETLWRMSRTQDAATAAATQKGSPEDGS